MPANPYRRRQPAKATRRTTKSTKNAKPGLITEGQVRRISGIVSDTIRFTWARPKSEDRIEGYQVQFQGKSRDGATNEWTDVQNTHTGTLTQYEANFVSQSVRFNMRVRARNSHGRGAWSKAFTE